MAIQTGFGARRSGLAAIITLHTGPPYQGVSSFFQSVGNEKFVVPGLVTTKCQTGAIIAFDENVRSTQRFGETGKLLQGGWQMREGETGQPVDALSQRADRKS